MGFGLLPRGGQVRVRQMSGRLGECDCPRLSEHRHRHSSCPNICPLRHAYASIVKHVWLLIPTVVSKLEDFSRLQAVTCTVKVLVYQRRCKIDTSSVETNEQVSSASEVTTLWRYINLFIIIIIIIINYHREAARLYAPPMAVRLAADLGPLHI